MMEWRIKKVKQPNGEVWFIPQYRKFLFFWRSITAIEHLRYVFNPFFEDAKNIDNHFCLKEPFDGYTYFFTEAEAMRTAELYERGQLLVTKK